MKKAFLLGTVLVFAFGLMYAWADQPNIQTTNEPTQVTEAQAVDQSQLEAEKAAKAGLVKPEAAPSDRPAVIVKPTGKRVEGPVDRTTNFSDLSEAKRLQEDALKAERLAQEANLAEQPEKKEIKSAIEIKRSQVQRPLTASVVFSDNFEDGDFTASPAWTETHNPAGWPWAVYADPWAVPGGYDNISNNGSGWLVGVNDDAGGSGMVTACTLSTSYTGTGLANLNLFYYLYHHPSGNFRVLIDGTQVDLVTTAHNGDRQVNVSAYNSAVTHTLQMIWDDAGSWGYAQGFDDVLLVDDPPALGACCYGDVGAPSCIDELEGDCLARVDFIEWTFGTACATYECPVVNPGDNCLNPLVITLPYAEVGGSNCNGEDYDATCLGSYDSGDDIIYEFTITEETDVYVTLDPKGTTYSGVGLAAECPPTTCLGLSTNSGGSAHGFNVLLPAGTYYIMIDTWATPQCIPDYDLNVGPPPTGRCCYYDEAPPDLYNPLCASPVTEDACVALIGAFSGTWNVNLNCVDDPCPVIPPNDDCANALAIGDVDDYTVDNSLATTDGTGFYANKNVWFCYTATCTGIVTVDLCGSNFDTKLAVYDGCVCSPLGTRLAYNDDNSAACGSYGPSFLTFNAVQGNQYLIEAGSYGSYMGTIVMDVFCTMPPFSGCEHFDISLGTMDNYSVGDDGLPWMWYDALECALHDWDDENDCDDYMITRGTFTVPAGAWLTYVEAVFDGDWAITQEVLISTDFAGDPETATWTMLNDAIPPADGYWFATAIDLSAYEGMDVNVAFHYVGYYASAWLVDDVCIENEGNLFDVGPSAIYDPANFQLDNTEFFPAVIVDNYGYQASGKFYVEYFLYDDAMTQLATQKDSVDNLGYAEQALVTFTTGVTLTDGIYFMKAITYPEVGLDDDPLNDTLSFDFFVGDVINDLEANNAFVLAATGDWAWGTPSVVGPAAPHSGVNCWATKLAANYTNTYSNLDLSVDIGTSTTAIFAFKHWYDTEEDGWDGGQVQIDDGLGGGFVPLHPHRGYDLLGYDGGCWTPADSVFTGHDQKFWELVVFDLSAYTGEVTLRLSFCGDGSVFYPGWYIDDFMFANCQPIEPQGACCDDETGTCADDVYQSLCPEPLRFTEGTLCADIYPPCGVPDGACCIGVGCEMLTEADCATAGGVWYPEETCETIVCPDPNCQDALFDNGMPNEVNGLSAIRRTNGTLDRWIIDDFVLTAETRITDFHFWGIDITTTFIDLADYIIVNDNAGVPGADTIVLALNMPATRELSNLVLFGFPVYVYAIENLDIVLGSGTYWVGLRPVDGGAGNNFWATADGQGSSVYLSYPTANPAWTNGFVVFAAYHNVAFCITGHEVGYIIGTVTDADGGAVIQGVNVAIEGTGISTETNEFGVYTLASPGGLQDVSFTHPIYDDTTVTGVNVPIGDLIFLNMVMTTDVVTIYDIQFNNTIVGSTDPDTCYTSPYDNDDVIVTGTVVAIQQDTSTTTPHPNYYIQDCATADWNGVYVYDDTQVGMALGDNVTLKADVDDYYGLTELKNVTEFVINSTGSPLCTLVVTNSDLLWECDPVAADGENLEGMLVKIVDAYLSSTASGGRAWIRTAGATDSVEVDDDLYVKGLDKPEPWEVGATYPYIMGMVQYSYGNYEFWPRFASDVAPLGFAYVPGDVNMSEGGWPPSPLSNDVTYLVNAFRGLPSSTACDFDGFWASADPNGDCAMLSNDVTFLVNFFRGLNTLDFCDDYPPLWLTPGDAPATKPDGWPFCDPPIVTGKVIPTSSPK